MSSRASWANQANPDFLNRFGGEQRTKCKWSVDPDRFGKCSVRNAGIPGGTSKMRMDKMMPYA
jgi:hypothetical protein